VLDGGQAVISRAGRRAIVTAAGQGIGASTVRLLAGLGAAVLLADFDTETVDMVAGSIQGAATVQLNVGDEANWRRWMRRAV
jgi:NAD(P)-dependent dehydrogenase (short-subunit alcohol dehydrogenase family)